MASYLVQIKDVSVCKEIRLAFSAFFNDGKDTRPDSIKKISIRNRVTQETHVRISILHLFGQRYVASNQGSQYKVIGYTPRPSLKLFPAQGASDRRVQSYTFIEAMRSLHRHRVRGAHHACPCQVLWQVEVFVCCLV